MPPTFHPDIAVIIPVYNAIQYLDECLNSIVSQTYRELESFSLMMDQRTEAKKSATNGRLKIIESPSYISRIPVKQPHVIPGFHTLIADLLLG